MGLGTDLVPSFAKDQRPALGKPESI